MPLQSFKDLNTWQEAHKLVLGIYEIAKEFPKEEMYGLTIQMKRAAVSVTSNIAEGFGRRSIKEKIQSYCIAEGSLTELLNQSILALDLKYISIEKFKLLEDEITQIHKLLHGLMRSANNKSSKY